MKKNDWFQSRLKKNHPNSPHPSNYDPKQLAYTTDNQLLNNTPFNCSILAKSKGEKKKWFKDF